MNGRNKILDSLQARRTEGKQMVKVVCTKNVNTPVISIREATRRFTCAFSIDLEVTDDGGRRIEEDVGAVIFTPYGTFEYDGAIYSFQDTTFIDEFLGSRVSITTLYWSDINLTKADYKEFLCGKGNFGQGDSGRAIDEYFRDSHRLIRYMMDNLGPARSVHFMKV